MKKSLRLVMVYGFVTVGLAMMPGVAFSTHVSRLDRAVPAPVESSGEIVTAYDYSFDEVVSTSGESSGEIVTAYDYSFDEVVSASVESSAVFDMRPVTTSEGKY